MDRGAASRSVETDDVVVERLRAVLAAAGEVETGISVEELADLLPSGAVHTPADLSGYLALHPPLGRVVDGVAFAPGVPAIREEDGARHARGRAYLDAAHRFVRSDLRPVTALLECVAVTGSAAYGEPEEGDDCDLFVVTRPGSVWVFLLFLYLRHRLAPTPRDRGAPAVWCANHVLDSRAAETSFAFPQGFLFAREALSARPVLGRGRYHRLIRAAPWMREEAPRLYARWEAEGGDTPPMHAPAPPALRVLNLCLFPLVATYLHMVAAWRNRRLRRGGRGDESYRVVTRLDRLTLLSDRYARLNAAYSRGSVTPTPSPRS